MTQEPSAADSPVISVMEAIRTRRSVRAYKRDPIPPALLERVTEAMRLAPSACNNQPWRFVLVRDASLREQLAHACANQMFIAPAPVIVAACAWPALASPRMGGYWNSAEVDVAIALDHLMLAATAEGLGTCWIGAFNETEVKKLLYVPEDVKVVALTPLGYPAREGLLRLVHAGDRKEREAVFALNRF